MKMSLYNAFLNSVPETGTLFDDRIKSLVMDYAGYQINPPTLDYMAEHGRATHHISQITQELAGLGVDISEVSSTAWAKYRDARPVAA